MEPVPSGERLEPGWACEASGREREDGEQRVLWAPRGELAGSEAV